LSIAMNLLELIRYWLLIFITNNLNKLGNIEFREITATTRSNLHSRNQT
jgi:hypothetical protein